MQSGSAIKTRMLLKLALKDAVRFYVFLLIFYSMTAIACFFYARVLLMLDSVTSSYQLEAIQNGFSVDSIYAFNQEDIGYITYVAFSIAFFLACFSVFFTLPPKSLKQVFLAIVVIWAPMIIAYLFIQSSSEAFYFLFRDIILALFPWTLAYIVQRLKHCRFG